MKKKRKNTEKWLVICVSKSMLLEKMSKRTKDTGGSALVEGAPDGIVSVDTEGSITYANCKLCELTGYSRDELTGKSWAELLPEEGRKEAVEDFRIILRERLPLAVYEGKLRRKDGTTIEVRIRWGFIEPSGESLVYIGVVRDTTGHRMGKEEMRLLLSVTRAIAEAPNFDSALEIALSRVVEATGWDYGEAWVPGEGALEPSPAYYTTRAELEKFRGGSEGFIFPPGVGLPGRVWVKGEPEWLVNASAEQELFLRHRIARETGLKAGFAVPITSGGEVFAVLAFFMSEARKEDSRLVELVSAVASQLGTVVKRRHAEEKLRESEERYRQNMQNSPNPIFFIDSEGVITTWKRACERTFKYGQEIVGQKYQKLLPREEGASIEEMVCRVFQGESFRNLELTFRDREGGERFTNSRVYPLFNAEGEVERCAFANTDITQ